MVCRRHVGIVALGPAVEADLEQLTQDVIARSIEHFRKADPSYGARVEQAVRALRSKRCRSDKVVSGGAGARRPGARHFLASPSLTHPG